MEWLRGVWRDMRGNVYYGILAAGFLAVWGTLTVLWDKLTPAELALIGSVTGLGWLAAYLIARYYSIHKGPLMIHSAKYGIDSIRSYDVAAHVESFVQGDKLEMTITNDTLNCDPFPGIKKLLTVVYSFG